MYLFKMYNILLHTLVYSLIGLQLINTALGSIFEVEIQVDNSNEQALIEHATSKLFEQVTGETQANLNTQLTQKDRHQLLDSFYKTRGLYDKDLYHFSFDRDAVKRLLDSRNIVFVPETIRPTVLILYNERSPQTVLDQLAQQLKAKGNSPIFALMDIKDQQAYHDLTTEQDTQELDTLGYRYNTQQIITYDHENTELPWCWSNQHIITRYPPSVEDLADNITQILKQQYNQHKTSNLIKIEIHNIKNISEQEHLVKLINTSFHPRSIDVVHISSDYLLLDVVYEGNIDAFMTDWGKSDQFKIVTALNPDADIAYEWSPLTKSS